MGSSKKAKVIYDETHDEYCRGFTHLMFTANIDSATNYGVLAWLYLFLFRRKYSSNYRIINTMKVSMNFDSHFEIETGGIKGFIGKIILKAIRILESVKNKQ